MNILLVSSYLPYPLFSGGHIRLYNLIKELSKKHKITLICEKRDYQTKDDIKKVEEYCKKVITVNRKKQWTIGNILKTGLSLSSFLITGHTSIQMKEEMKRELNESQFDLIHVETSYVMQNIPATEIPVVLAEHNIEYLVYKRFADKAPLVFKPLLYIDVLKLKYWEEKMWNKATKLVAVSKIEKEIMDKIRDDVVVVANGVDVEKFKVSGLRHPTSDIRILFIGEFKWVQNRDAIEWILREIWPSIRNPKFQILNPKLWVVGRNIPDSIRKLTSDKNIIFDENAPKETELIYQKADVLLAPIRVGGGTSFKILEAMASGVPVVTTSLGNEGIGAKEQIEVLIAKDSSEFAEKILDLLQNAKLYEKIAINARKLIEAKYDWEKIVGKLEVVYKAVINAHLSS